MWCRWRQRGSCQSRGDGGGGGSTCGCGEILVELGARARPRRRGTTSSINPDPDWLIEGISDGQLHWLAATEGCGVSLATRGGGQTELTTPSRLLWRISSYNVRKFSPKILIYTDYKFYMLTAKRFIFNILAASSSVCGWRTSLFSDQKLKKKKFAISQHLKMKTKILRLYETLWFMGDVMKCYPAAYHRCYCYILIIFRT